MKLALLGLLLASVVLVACSDDDTTTPPPIDTVAATNTVPAATATQAAPSPTPINCPHPQAVCALGLQIEQELSAQNYDAIVDQFSAQPIVCTGVPAQGPPAIPVCDGAAAGETRQAYSLSRRYSEGAAVSEEAMRQSIEGFVTSLLTSASDQWGPGSLDFYTIGCVEPAGTGQCGRFAYVFSGIVGPASQQHREVLIFFAFQAAPGQALEIVELRTGITLPQEEQAMYRGGGSTIDLGELVDAP